MDTHKRLENPTPRGIFHAEVNYWAEKMGVQPTEVYIREMKNKWGSCSAGGRISFNSELLWQPPGFRRQIIQEELQVLKQQLEGREPPPGL